MCLEERLRVTPTLARTLHARADVISDGLDENARIASQNDLFFHEFYVFVVAVDSLLKIHYWPSLVSRLISEESASRVLVVFALLHFRPCV